MLRSNCCCSYGDKIIYISEGYRFFFEFNTLTGETTALDWPKTKSRPAKIFYYKDVFYAIDSYGKWIGKLLEDSARFEYTELTKGTECKGFACIAIYKGRFYMFDKNNMKMFVFNPSTGKIELIDIGSIIPLKDCFNTVTCSGNTFYLLSGESEKIILLSLDDYSYREVAAKGLHKTIDYAVVYNGIIYYVARNTIYMIENATVRELEHITDANTITKICVTEKHIFALPGTSDSIYRCSKETHVVEQICDCPIDLEYDSSLEWTRYKSCVEVHGIVYWIARVGNYSLAIDKANSELRWMKNSLVNAETLSKMVLDRYSVVDEKLVDLNTFISLLDEGSSP